MVRMFVRHSVADYDAWKAGYDAFDETRTGLGASGHDVFRTVGNENEVTAWHDFETREAAEAFVASSELRTAMEGAGVVGAPQVWIATAS